MNGRTKFVVGWMAFLYVISWMMSLGRLIGQHFWDKQHALSHMMTSLAGDNDDETIINNIKSPSSSSSLEDIATSYFSTSRYLYFAPHVFGAIFWWNLYFLQLIPSVRHAFNKNFHRILGRMLMVCATLQIVTGVGLALTSHSNVVLLISIVLAIAVSYCIYNAWRYAICRDIHKHKYWVMRLVGYMQTIALQRFWFLVLMVSYQLGWYGLYPNATTPDVANQVVLDMFDHSFILCILTAVFVTEWYLAGEQGMLEEPVRSSSEPGSNGKTPSAAAAATANVDAFKDDSTTYISENVSPNDDQKIPLSVSENQPLLMKGK
jgi:Predicted membrane protein (DUF2306)